MKKKKETRQAVENVLDVLTGIRMDSQGPYLYVFSVHLSLRKQNHGIGIAQPGQGHAKIAPPALLGVLRLG